MHNVSLPLVPFTPLGLENQILSDNYLSNPSQLNSSTGPYLVRLNEQHDSKAWRSTGSSKRVGRVFRKTKHLAEADWRRRGRIGIESSVGKD